LDPDSTGGEGIKSEHICEGCALGLQKPATWGGARVAGAGVGAEVGLGGLKLPSFSMVAAHQSAQTSVSPSSKPSHSIWVWLNFMKVSSGLKDAQLAHCSMHRIQDW